MKIIALSMAKMKNIQHSDIVANKKWAVISIATIPNNWPTIEANENFKGVLRLTFADIDSRYKDLVMFSEDHAEEIIGFVDALKDDLDVLIVHCEAGLSRSPAVAAALHHEIYGNDGPFFKSHYPNRFVYRTLMNAYNARKIKYET